MKPASQNNPEPAEPIGLKEFKQEAEKLLARLKKGSCDSWRDMVQISTIAEAVRRISA